MDIDDLSNQLIKLRSWKDEYVDQLQYKMESLSENSKEMDEKVTFFYTKIEREEFFDIND